MHCEFTTPYIIRFKEAKILHLARRNATARLGECRPLMDVYRRRLQPLRQGGGKLRASYADGNI